MTVATGILSVVNPGVLIAIPLAFLALFYHAGRLATVAVAVFLFLLAFSGTPVTGLWYVERGWAILVGGWFLAVTLRWPKGAFISRGIGAVSGAFAAMGLLFWSRPGQWAVVDWAVTSRLEEGMAMALQALRDSLGPQAVPAATEAWLLEAMALNGMVFPAVLGLASLCALGVAWWGFLRLSRARAAGIGPLQEFRFNDQLVWILILGFVLLLGFSGALERMGVNAVLFMGVLYALRGFAVALALLGGPTLILSMVFLLLFIVAAPLLVAGAFVFGLGDTWLDLRARLGGESPR